MLTKLLRPETCAACRQCCQFDGYDIYETPVLTTEDKERVLRLYPETELLINGDTCLFRMQTCGADGSYPCPLLDPETGCRLGDQKPFDCRSFPFCVRELQGRRLIAVAAPLCDAIAALPLGTLLQTLREGLAEELFSYAAAHPEVVRPYREGYPILLWEPKH